MPEIRSITRIKITGDKTATRLSFMPRATITGNKAANSREEPSRLARLLDRTRSHLGKYTFVTRVELPVMESSDIEVLMEKNRQRSSPGRTKTGKFGIEDLNRVVKNIVSITIIARGFKRDQKNPRIEFLYLSLKSFMVRFKTKSLY